MRFEKKLKLFFRNLVLYLPILAILLLCVHSSSLSVLDTFFDYIIESNLFNEVISLLEYLGYDILSVNNSPFELIVIWYATYYLLVHVIFVVIDLITLPIHWVRILLDKSEVNI